MRTQRQLVFLTALLIAAAAPAGSSALSPPGVSVRSFGGDLADQAFVTLTGNLVEVGRDGRRTRWECRLVAGESEAPSVIFRATSTTDGDTVRWNYAVTNREPEVTVCGVTFPIIGGVRLSASWREDRVLWPSLYQGALIDDLTSAEAFEAQAKEACKGVARLHGMYQGDLCLPFFVHLGRETSFGLMVLDPTHEVIALDGSRDEAGMTYQVTTYPRIPAGKTWRFGDIEVFRHRHGDWHQPADRYRKWLVSEGLRPERPGRGDIAAFMYGRWDGLRPEEAIRWAKALDIRDVCLWVVLYGRGDQYYPCYFPPLELGVEGLARQLEQLRTAGLSPYFYTNGYLLSPLQTAGDAREWSEKFPQQYPAWLAEGDTGYGDAVARYRATGREFAGGWLEQPGGILPPRVRRVDFQWGEFPVYFWHQRPFWAACVAAPEWRKLFRDTARLHAEMGASGIFMDQVAAMHPELCAASGHGHDSESFGLWNRAYLRLLAETKQAGQAIRKGFFIEVEGASDLYARHVDRFLCSFGPPPARGFPRLLRYTVPWARTDAGQFGLEEVAPITEHIERTLLLGCIFRVSGGGPTGDDDPDDPRLKGEAARLLRSAIGVRRALSDFIDRGRYMDDVGLESDGCDEARWFDSRRGGFIAARAERGGAEVRLDCTRNLALSAARRVDWRSGTSAPIIVRRQDHTLVAEDLPAGLSLVVVPVR